MPKLEQFEIKKYWQIFSGLKPVGNKLNHDQVSPILFNSKLDSSILNKIWFLADIDDDDSLDFEEFVICMRLIFDMVNKNIDKVPDELPDWLVPGSKSSLIAERKKRKIQENAEIPKAEQPKVDWYMAPEDLSQYGKILESCTLSRDGTVTFPSISYVIKTKFFNLGSSDIDKVWNLVNPKRLPSIDKDPAFYFIHCLRQCNDVGARIPTELPKALFDICNKERVSYDMNSNQGNVKKISPTPSTNTHEKEHAASISTRTGVSYGSNSTNNGSNINMNKAGSSENLSDSDIKRLEEELAQLDSELAQLETENKMVPQNSPASIREQLEGLLSYMEEKAYERNRNKNVSVPFNINEAKDDLENIEEQITVLEGYLQNKQSELHDLRTEIASFH